MPEKILNVIKKLLAVFFLLASIYIFYGLFLKFQAGKLKFAYDVFQMGICLVSLGLGFYFFKTKINETKNFFFSNVLILLITLLFIFYLVREAISTGISQDLLFMMVKAILVVALIFLVRIRLLKD
ncbi:membrane hypothetical protein [Nitrospina gracilis 3/211]|uniref:Uncharacterized protein n=1 Tax=Nitrospina gracilis (strain 3/211) TaxID=1266370 RepID=M1ZC53_NITG3|nr:MULTISPECIES: hypothetical protein [Nitrospina]MCF8723758.1 FlaA1/EpsC-like NDP-sugar epimerase [Nitrospina sp. Nb-3]CCQ90863.1 membrane hypothetical protein [Nitrospina gracilis 3/211]